MKTKKYLRIFINFVFWCIVAGIAGVAALVLLYGHDLPDYKNLATYTPPVATRLYAADGSLLIEYAEERRVSSRNRCSGYYSCEFEQCNAHGWF